MLLCVPYLSSDAMTGGQQALSEVEGQCPLCADALQNSAPSPSYHGKALPS